MKKIQLLISDTALVYRDMIPNKYVTLSHTIYESSEGIFGDFKDPLKYDFYGLDQVIDNKEARNENNRVLMEYKFFLSPKYVKVKRKLYDVLKMMSEIGGFLKLVNLIFSHLASPIG